MRPTRSGRGGFGEVLRADDLDLGQSVALKFLSQKVAGDPQRLGRFRKEVGVARWVAHPDVGRVYNIGEAGGECFITVEYVDGEDLASNLQRMSCPSKARPRGLKPAALLGYTQA